MLPSKEYFTAHLTTGFCLVFIHRRFRGTPGQVRHPKRGVNQITKTFHKLGFQVLVQKDYTKKQIISLLENIASLDHSNEDCLAIVVLTSRRHNGMLCAYDGEYPEESLWQPFAPENCPSLNKKPKLLFIQSFGKNEGMTLEGVNSARGHASSTASQGPIPEDFLVSWSMLDECKAYKTLGFDDIYISHLCRELTRRTQEGYDLVTIISQLEERVMKEIPEKPEFLSHLALQRPTHASTLDGLVFFQRKNLMMIERIVPIDKNLENYTSESECEDGDYSYATPKGRAIKLPVDNELDGKDDAASCAEDEDLGDEGEVGVEEGSRKSRLENKEYSVTFFQLMLRWLFLTLYVVDEGSDLYAGFNHLKHNRMVFAAITFILALVPHILSILVGWKKAKVTKTKFQIFGSLTYHARGLWQALVLAYKSRHTYERISLEEERAYNTHVRAWNGLDKSNTWDGDSKKIQRMYYEKMMTVILNLSPCEVMEVIIQSPYQMAIQLTSFILEKRMITLYDSPRIISILTSLVSLSSAIHKDHYRLHFSKDWSNSLVLKARLLECTIILLVLVTEAVSRGMVYVYVHPGILFLSQLPFIFWKIRVWCQTRCKSHYKFMKNPVKNTLSLMVRRNSSWVMAWEYGFMENAYTAVDAMLLIITGLYSKIYIYIIAGVCIACLHFLNIFLSSLYRKKYHIPGCNSEISLIQ